MDISIYEQKLNIWFYDKYTEAIKELENNDPDTKIIIHTFIDKEITYFLEFSKSRFHISIDDRDSNFFCATKDIKKIFQLKKTNEEFIEEIVDYYVKFLLNPTCVICKIKKNTYKDNKCKKCYIYVLERYILDKDLKDCCICLEPLLKNTINICGNNHIIHRYCFDASISSCPICREDLFAEL